MRFKLSERYDHWPFEGTNYKLHFYLDDLINEKITPGMEVRMMDWLEDRKISHAWNIEDTITFKRDQDRTLFMLKFSHK